MFTIIAIYLIVITIFLWVKKQLKNDNLKAANLKINLHHIGVTLDAFYKFINIGVIIGVIGIIVEIIKILLIFYI